MITDKIYPAFRKLNNSSEIMFMRDGVPPHWAKSVRIWMHVHLPDRWIGRGTANDKHIPWPPRSPDLTPMDYILWGYIKSKVYVRNYENLDDLKASVSAEFQEVSREMLISTMSNFSKRMKKVVKVRGRHIEN